MSSTTKGPLAIAALLSAVATAGCGATRRPAPAPALADNVRRFVELVNEHRETIGCGALAWHSAVADVAQAHSVDMASREFAAHRNPDGQGAGDRLEAARIGWHRWAENLAFGPETPEALLAAWLRSPGHRRNIEDCGFTHHGIGLDRGRWTHLFLRR